MADNTDVSEDGAASKKGGLRNLLMLIPVLLIGFGSGGFVMVNNYEEIVVTMRVMFGIDIPEPPPEEEELDTFGVFHEMDPIIVNPRNSDGLRVLSCKVGLEGRDDKIIAEAQAKLVVIRAAITQILSEQTTAQLNDVDYRDDLREQVKVAVNEILDPVKVDRIYFTTFILQ